MIIPNSYQHTIVIYQLESRDAELKESFPDIGPSCADFRFMG
jgi:hypothetical protein